MKNAKAVSSKTIFFYCSFQGFQFVDFDLFSVSLCLSCYLCSSPSLGHSFYELIYFGIQKKKSEPNSVETVDCLSICLSNSTLSFVQLHGIRTLFFFWHNSFNSSAIIHFRNIFLFYLIKRGMNVIEPWQDFVFLRRSGRRLRVLHFCFFSSNRVEIWAHRTLLWHRNICIKNLYWSVPWLAWWPTVVQGSKYLKFLLRVCVVWMIFSFLFAYRATNCVGVLRRVCGWIAQRQTYYVEKLWNEIKQKT